MEQPRFTVIDPDGHVRVDDRRKKI